MAEPAGVLRRWAWVGVLVLHLAGGFLVYTTLLDAWQQRFLLQILAGRSTPTWAAAIATYVVPGSLVLVVALAVAEASRVSWGAWRRRPERDLALRLRVLVYFGLACLCTCVFVLSTPEAYHGPFRVRHPIIAGICAALYYGGYCLWSMSRTALQRVVPRRFGRRVDLVCMNLVGVAVLLEISLRGLALTWGTPLLVTESSPSQIRRNAERAPPGMLRFGFPMNSGGHYDAEFVPSFLTPGPVVASIGDSFSYGMVPHRYHFTTVAERALPGVEFYNLGYSGIGPSDYRYLLEHQALPLAPDLVLIQIFVGNDVSAGSSPAGPARWFDADSYLTAVVWYRLSSLRNAGIRDVGKDVTPGGGTHDDLLTTFPWLEDPSREAPSLGTDVYFGLELRNALAVNSQNRMVYLHFFSQIEAIERTAGKVPLAFVLIPDEYQVEADVWSEVSSRSGIPLERDRPQREIVEWMVHHGLPVLDLLPVMRAVEPLADGRRHLYHLQDTHFNARGNDVAGRAIARFVATLLPRHRAAALPAATLSLPVRIDAGDEHSRRWMARGWHRPGTRPGRKFAWSDSDRSFLTLPLPTGEDIRMSFEVLPFVFPGSDRQAVTVVLNGREIGTVPLRPRLQGYSVVLPAGGLREGLDVIELRYAYARSPVDVLSASNDHRTLAVAWYSIEFSEPGP